MNRSVAYDRRDVEVLKELDRQGIEVVDSEQLKRLYRKLTDVRRERTAKERVKWLTDTNDFENVAFGRWRWSGELPPEGR